MAKTDVDPLVLGISQIDPKSENFNPFLRIEAHVETNCAGSSESGIFTKLCFFLLWGLKILKFICKNSDFG